MDCVNVLSIFERKIPTGFSMIISNSDRQFQKIA